MMAAERPISLVCMDSSKQRSVLRTVVLLEDEVTDEEERFWMRAEAVDEEYCWLKLLAARFSSW